MSTQRTPPKSTTSKRSFTEESVDKSEHLSPDSESWFTPSRVDQTPKRIKLIANSALRVDAFAEMDKELPEKSPLEKFLDAQAERETAQAVAQVERETIQEKREIESLATLKLIHSDIKGVRSELKSIKSIATKNTVTLETHAKKFQEIETKMLMMESQLSKINTFGPARHTQKQSNRLLIFNLPGIEQGQDLIDKVQEFIENTLLVRGVLALHARRFRAQTNKPGTVLVTLEDREALISLLSNGKNLQGTPQSISEDLPPEARLVKNHILKERIIFIDEGKEVKLRSFDKIIVNGITYQSNGKELTQYHPSTILPLSMESETTD